MSADEKTCPLCESTMPYAIDPGHHRLYRYAHTPCEPFCMWHHDEITFLQNPAERHKWHPARIIALLAERRLRSEGAITPMLLFRDKGYPEVPDTEPLPVRELLAQWPTRFRERLDRAFCNLARRCRGRVDSDVVVNTYGRDVYLFFAVDGREQEYLIEAMVERGWIRKSREDHSQKWFTIAPAGWDHFDKLSGGEDSLRNPAFVAMWFGGKEQRQDMDRLYREAIAPAIMAAGYSVKRADKDEHNEPIMDRIIEDIRAAPFVVAELTDHNSGVYYEAGFAKGRGIEVIYCCPEEHKPHFDVTGINLVKWKDQADLRRRLEDRVFGSQGKGPYDFSDASPPSPAQDGDSDDHR